jgi:hypothetical protein
VAAREDRAPEDIADRRAYSDQVFRYNTRIAQPANALAALLGWRRSRSSRRTTTSGSGRR